MTGQIHMYAGQFDVDMREIGLDRADATDKLVELTFNTLQATAHFAQKGKHKIVRLVGHGRPQK